MKTVGYDQPLYILPFDPRGSFETKRFDWHGDLTPEQTAEIAAAKQVIYGGFKAAKTITREADVAEIARLSGIRRHFREGTDRLTQQRETTKWRNTQ